MNCSIQPLCVIYNPTDRIELMVKLALGTQNNSFKGWMEHIFFILKSFYIFFLSSYILQNLFTSQFSLTFICFHYNLFAHPSVKLFHRLANKSYICILDKRIKLIQAVCVGHACWCLRAYLSSKIFSGIILYLTIHL